MSRRASKLWIPLVLVATGSPLAGQTREAASFRVSQAVQATGETVTVRAYLDVLDTEGEPLAVLERDALTATIGGAAATPVGLEALASSREGVAYIFLVDISRSLSAAEFDRIRGAIDLWVSSLGAADRVAVIAFGEASRLELDFTNDFAAAREALARLGPTDDLTVFHRALRDGMELARRRDPDLPGRRVLVVLGDGKDEGSGLTAGDMLAILRADPVPIYAIGFSRLRSAQERARYLGLLNRLATNSGGAYIEAAQGTVEESYAAMLAAARRVWVVILRCADCRLDGDTYRLQVNLSDGERVLSDGRQLRLLPQAAAVATGAGVAASGPPAAAETPADGAEDVVRSADRTDRGESADEAPRGAGARWWLPLLVLLLAPPAVWLWRRRSLGATGSTAGGRGAPETGGAADDAAAPAKTEAAAAKAPPGPVAYETPTGVLTSRPPKPPTLRLVRLIVVRGQRVGRQYSLMLLERGVVGARSTCDCVLVAEPGVEPEQFELLQIDGRVYIRNLASHRPTLLDGLPIDDREPIDSQTLVGNSDCILRVIYDEPRRVPL